jgi:hypothetical protein
MITKKGQLELSIGTIVVLVIGVSMLILGIILVRSIMCSGLQITEDLSTGVRNEVKNLFGSEQVGVKCVGEGGADVKFATGGRRKLFCLIKTEETTNYALKVTELTSLKGATTEQANQWALSKEWTGSVSPGTERDADVLLLDIPRDAPTSVLRIKIQVTKGTNLPEDRISTVDIVPTGFIKGAIC